MNSNMVERLARVMTNYRFQFASEKELQDAFEMMLKHEGFEYRREVRLTAQERVDFLIDEKVAAEVKIAGSAGQHRRQLKRYADAAAVSETVLIATRPYPMPATLSGKPCCCLKVERRLS